MAKKATDPTTTTENTGPVQVQRKSPFDWKAALSRAEGEAWRGLRVTIQIRDKLYAGTPASLNAAQAMIKARGLEELVEAVKQNDPAKLQELLDQNGLAGAIRIAPSPEDATPAAAIEAVNAVKDEGLCVFHRRGDVRPGVWMPSNNFKAGLKENLSVLGITVDTRGSKGAMAEGVFVRGVPPAFVQSPGAEDFDWIYLGEKADGTDAMVAHTNSARGPVSSIKRHEFRRGCEIQVDILISNASSVASKLSDENLARVMVHFAEHGLGACRSQGAGKFVITGMEEIAVSAGIAVQLREKQDEQARAAG